MDSSIVYKYFPNLSEDQSHKINGLASLYQNWNEKINVVSRKDIDELYLRHVLHSLAISKVIDFGSSKKVIDVGTGGGFPGIPLAILYPEVKFHLVDSIGKKVKVCNEIASELSLSNVFTQHDRMEKIMGKYDHVVSRAVAPTKKLIGWTSQLIKDGGTWAFLKGGDLNEELLGLKKSYHVVSVSDFFEEPFFETKKVVVINN